MSVRTFAAFLSFFAAFVCGAGDCSRVPVVMLHGWNSDSGIWGNLRTLLVEDAGYSSNELSALDFAGDTPIEELAVAAARLINERYPEGQVDVVAHSMGGLVARSMLAQGLVADGRIRRLVTLGTPHYGVVLGGVGIGVDTPSSQMACGSTFLWDLACAWYVDGRRPSDTLCIVGAVSKFESGAYTDGLVPAASAALAGEKVFHVSKYHAETYSSLGEVIYEMKGGTKDIVYRAVKRFLLSGDAPDDSESDCSKKILDHVSSHGGVLGRVVDPAGKPMEYSWMFLFRGNMIIDGIDDEDVDCYYGSGDYSGDDSGIVSTYADLTSGFHKFQFNVPDGNFGGKYSITAVNRLPIAGGTYSLCRFQYDGDGGGRVVPLSPVPFSDRYTLRFYKAGGTGYMADKSVAGALVIALPRCTLTPPAGRTRFAGWHCSNGKRYDDGMLVFDLAQPGETVTMTAVWE